MNNLYFVVSLKNGLLDLTSWIFAQSEDEIEEMLSKENIEDFYIFELPPEHLEYLIWKG